jgi:hypothetical protein
MSDTKVTLYPTYLPTHRPPIYRPTDRPTDLRGRRVGGTHGVVQNVAAAVHTVHPQLVVLGVGKEPLVKAVGILPVAIVAAAFQTVHPQLAVLAVWG